jgi:hypothetical protein
VKQAIIRPVFGCAAMIGLVAFVIGLVLSLFRGDKNSPSPLVCGAISGGMAFFAALLLFARDSSRQQAAISFVRRKLLGRQGVDDSEFCRHFPDCDAKLVIDIRAAIGAFYNVPPERVHPNDSLQQDLRVDTLEPSFHYFVISHIAECRKVTLGPFSFRLSALQNLHDFATEIQTILNALEMAANDQDLDQHA